MRKTLVLLLCLALVGCATTSPIHSKDIMTEIISDPPGAKIEINNQYIGETPLTIHIKRTFTYDYWKGFSITAYPVSSGQYTQSKYIGMDESTPTKVYFNMNLVPRTPEYNINIQNK